MEYDDYELHDIPPPDDVESVTNTELETILEGEESLRVAFLESHVLPWQEIMKQKKTEPICDIFVEVEDSPAPVAAVPKERSFSPEYPAPVISIKRLERSGPPKRIREKVTAPRKKPYPKVTINSEIRKIDVSAFRARKLDLETSHSLVGHPELLLKQAKEFKLDFRVIFDRMPEKYRYEIMDLMPKKYVIITPEGRVDLKHGVLGTKDKKFKDRLRTFQSRLKAGEHNTDVRKIRIQMMADKMDPWKAANFEPVYGDLCRQTSETSSVARHILSGRGDSLDTRSLSPSTLVCVNSPAGRSEKENESRLSLAVDLVKPVVTVRCDDQDDQMTIVQLST